MYLDWIIGYLLKLHWSCVRIVEVSKGSLAISEHHHKVIEPEETSTIRTTESCLTSVGRCCWQSSSGSRQCGCRGTGHGHPWVSTAAETLGTVWEVWLNWRKKLREGLIQLTVESVKRFSLWVGGAWLGRSQHDIMVFLFFSFVQSL